MNKTAAALCALLGALFAAAPASAPAIAGEPAPPSAAPAASPSAPAPSTSASAASEAPDDPGMPGLDVDPPGPEKSKLPTPAEWATAPRVRLARTGPAAAGCRAYRLREWLRVRCPKLTTSAMSLLGGSAEGVAFWIDPPPDPNSLLPGGGEVLLPLRRGDRRVIQIATFGEGYDGPLTVLPAVIVQEHWAPGAPAPIVIAM